MGNLSSDSFEGLPCEYQYLFEFSEMPDDFTRKISATLSRTPYQVQGTRTAVVLSRT